MAVVTNASRRALVRAHGKVAVSRLSRGDLSGREVAERIVRAAEIALYDHDRAITHNKGVLNGITALTLATGNDTRSVEASAHGWAASSGSYRPLTRFQILDDKLQASIECPLLLGTVGGSIDIHPVSRIALQILGKPVARRLAAIAAAVGLAQNLAALRALVSEGIQEGHMRLHAERLAYSAGARGTEVGSIAKALVMVGKIDLSNAHHMLAAQRLERD
jgi:hydroxymethylglutaryl-CoA reductase